MTDSDGRTDVPGSPVPSVAVACCLLVASLIPVPSVGTPGGGEVGAFPVDVGLTDPFHLVGYAALAALVARTTGGERRGSLVAVGVATAFGFGVEVVQAPIPWRSFAWSDAAVNAVGAVGGALVAAGAVAVERRRTRRRP